MTRLLAAAWRSKKAVLLVVLVGVRAVNAQYAIEQQPARTARTESSVSPSFQPPNIRMKTLGGKQFWGDVLFFRGWTIQQHILTKHYRLLDERDHRHAWGSHEACVAKLAKIRREQQLAPMSGEAVILLHGIGRSSKVMARMKDRFDEQGFLTVPFDYPSTRVDLTDCSNYLDRVIDSLDGVHRISFVAHSMGGLVVRNWMDLHEDERIHRLVMISSPNHGAELADHLHNWPIYRLLGPAGAQLVSDPAGTIANLPTPQIPFAVIAGAKGTPGGYNPLIEGDDDSMVSVASARLPGAADYLDVPVLHSFQLADDRVIHASLLFVKTGALRESGDRQPIAPTSQ